MVERSAGSEGRAWDPHESPADQGRSRSTQASSRRGSRGQWGRSSDRRPTLTAVTSAGSSAPVADISDDPLTASSRPQVRLWLSDDREDGSSGCARRPSSASTGAGAAQHAACQADRQRNACLGPAAWHVRQVLARQHLAAEVARPHSATDDAERRVLTVQARRYPVRSTA